MKVKEKVGDFALDIAKLIFGGVILSSIMSESINSVVVYSLGLFFFIFTTALGFVLIDNTGKKGGNI
ncbi:DUF6722 family protein [uncultured Parabacteroides sp.]|uniref:DUF6722 family protein n=1 Tax=uncultured Parabacteroides sp. TaxID=512312 RepID=UPI0025FE1248|nr:DUF6722 family protein [uncultured Parabacteroides sp.]